MSQLSPSPRYQSDIKFRWCPTVDCRGINNVLLVLTSVTGTQIGLLWRDDLGWYESELCRLPVGLHTAIIVLNTKVYDENWKCISREKQFKVDTFHIVSHKFAIELFLDSNEEISLWSDTPTLRNRYLSSDNLDYTGKGFKTDTNDSEDINYLYNSTPDLKYTPSNNKNEKDFDHTLNAVKFLSNRVKSLGLSTNAGQYERSRISLFEKFDTNFFLQKDEKENKDLQIAEYDTLSINPESHITKRKGVLLEESVFEYSNYPEISANDESDIWDIKDKRKENVYAVKNTKDFIENMNEDDKQSSCKLITHDISITYNTQSTNITTFSNGKDFSKENICDGKTDSTITLKKLKNKPINRTIDLDDDNNFHYDSLKGEDAALHIDIKNINESNSDDSLSENYRKKVKINEDIFSFNNSEEKLNLDKENEIIYMNYEEPINSNDGSKDYHDECIYDIEEYENRIESKEAINTSSDCNISKENVNDSVRNNSLQEVHLSENELDKRCDQIAEHTEVTSDLTNQENTILEVNKSNFQTYKTSFGRSSESVEGNMNSYANNVTKTKIKKEDSLSQIKIQSESSAISYENKNGNLIDNDFFENGVKDTFKYAGKSLNKDFPLCDEMGMNFKQLRETNNSVRLKNSLLPNKQNVVYSRQSNRSKFLIPSNDYIVQQNLALLQRNLYSRCSPNTKDLDNSYLNSTSLYNSNNRAIGKDRQKFGNDSILRNRNLCANDISTNVLNDNVLSYKTRNNFYKSTVDKSVTSKKIGSKDLYSNHIILDRSSQSNNTLYQKSIHGTRSRLFNFTNSNEFGGSLNNLHEYPPQQTFSSRFKNESKRRKVSSFPDLRYKENSPYKSRKYSESRHGSQNINLYNDNNHTRYGIDIYKPLDDLDGSGDSTESLLDEADKIRNISLKI